MNSKKSVKAVVPTTCGGGADKASISAGRSYWRASTWLIARGVRNLRAFVRIVRTVDSGRNLAYRPFVVSRESRLLALCFGAICVFFVQSMFCFAERAWLYQGCVDVGQHQSAGSAEQQANAHCCPTHCHSEAMTASATGVSIARSSRKDFAEIRGKRIGRAGSRNRSSSSIVLTNHGRSVPTVPAEPSAPLGSSELKARIFKEAAAQKVCLFSGPSGQQMKILLTIQKILKLVKIGIAITTLASLSACASRSWIKQANSGLPIEAVHSGSGAIMTFSGA